MIYYEILLFEDELSWTTNTTRDRIKWLEYHQDDGGLGIEQVQEDESLAMKILLYYREKTYSELLDARKEDPDKMIGYVIAEEYLRKIIMGAYSHVTVRKYAR